MIYRKPLVDFSQHRIIGKDGEDRDWFPAVQKDSLMWEIAATTGGIFLDLDTTSLLDISEILGEADFVSGIDIRYADSIDYGWRNNAIIICQPESVVAKELWARTASIYLDTDELWYYALGPSLLSQVVNDHVMKKHFEMPGSLDAEVITPPDGVLGGFSSIDEVQDYFSASMKDTRAIVDTVLKNTRVIHWFGQTDSPKSGVE